jgi:hypothetical protein
VTVARALLVLSMMAAIALVIVAVRGENAKAANRVQRLHHHQVALEQKLWTQEMELARLRGPDEIRRRANELGLDVVPPKTLAAPNKVGGAD